MDTIESVREPNLDTQLRQLERRLRDERDEVPPAVLHEWVESARARFAEARIVTFVPILVERLVRTHLDLDRIAARTAERLLAGTLPRRWAHTQGVARRAAEIAGLLSHEDGKVLAASAWLHDIGYAPDVAELDFHQLDGARYLARAGWPERICALVAHHAGAAAVAELTGLTEQLAAFDDEQSVVRDALWYCDMTTGPDGQPVSFADRMAELRARRGPGDPVVRALATNEEERAAAVRRTEMLLSH
ncbi:three-helix bundle dimerization domain-containing protein [Amycolatopsis pithecellobii]|uniref:HD domain-containing protein n=1 Tax=Amycolatopsis pithecellobii TaxID=664692 RepID=A0A6N7Z0U1_9PSEU|nr:HD domain-containing protein [Amycolatopsis pithecellobii]MTD53411.1 HD domain-containing protein [Amycolatopsis pithecellobii]